MTGNEANFKEEVVLSQLDLTASLLYLLPSLALPWQPEEPLNRFTVTYHQWKWSNSKENRGFK